MPTLHLQHTVRTAVEPTERVCRVAAMFGLGLDASRTLQIIPPTSLTLAPGLLLLITGASGGGKSTLLKLIAQSLRTSPGVRIVDFDAPPDAQPDKPLVDLLGATLDDAVRYLSLAGLSDAFVMLRSPAQLSDGQRSRWKLARAMERVGEVERASRPLSGGTPDPLKADPLQAPALTVVLADEFGSTLDRLTASIVARNVRKWVTASRACFIAATAHDDLLEHLQPDTLVVQEPGEPTQVLEKPPSRT